MTMALADTTGRRDAVWRAAAALALVVLGVGLLYRDALIAVWRVWLGSTAYNHCALIPLLAGFMAWNRRERLKDVRPDLDWPMLALLPAVLLVWLAARLLNVMEIQQFAIVTMLEVSALVLLGWPIYRRLLAPFLFLYLLVPTGMFLVLPLQNFTAKFVVLGLELSGIPVVADGTVIQVSSGTFVVAEACAGLRFLIAAIAFGIFFACEVYSSVRRRLAFIALCFVIPIFANGLRAFGLVVAAEQFGTASAIEADHVLYGWIFFSIVLFALIWVGHLFADRPAFAPHGGLPAPLSPSSPQAGILAVALAAGACLLLAAGGPLTQAALAKRISISLPSGPPAIPAGWHEVGPSPDWQPKVRRGDRVFSDAIEKDGQRIDRFVALYVPHGVPSNPASGEDRLADPEVWRPVSAGRRSIMVQGQPIFIQTLEAVAPGEARRMIWGFYMADGRPAATAWAARWQAFRSYLSASRCPSAFVAISVRELGAENGLLSDYLANSDLSKSYVCR